MDDVAEWELRYDVTARAWRELIEASEASSAVKVDRWRDSFDAAKHEQQKLATAGKWLGGQPTLLAAIGRQYSELAMTAALGWLLRPDGHHGLGRAVLDEFAKDLEVDLTGPVWVVLEEVRHDTRSDLVVYGTGWTLIVEAKTFSSERPRQLARIHELWGREDAPTFVFLTRLKTDPKSAGASAAFWRNRLWRQVAASVRAAIAKTDPAVIAGGVNDYLTTLELFHDASGSGKSTFLNILGLLDRPTAGTYELAGTDIGSLPEKDRTAVRGRRIGFVFQSFHLLHHRTATENVALAMVYGGTLRADRVDAARAALDIVGLSHRAEALPRTMSGGEQQRVAIARAFVHQPSLLLCDEPTGNLDSARAGEILELLDELHSTGITIVVITHDLAVARRGQRSLTIKDGTVS